MISNWQVWRAACWPFPPKTPGRRRQICREFHFFGGRAKEIYPDFDIVVTRHLDRRAARKAAYIQETGVMIAYAELPTELMLAFATLGLLDAAAVTEFREG